VLGPVFRTFEPQSEKLVAVKAFRLDVVPEVSARLADALRHLVATSVDHPAIVPAIAGGLEGTTAFLASEYVAAETLDVSLRHLAPAPLESVLALVRPLAEGLEAAWAEGLGHGALHPRDIFVMPGSGARVTGIGVVAALEKLHIPAPVRRPYSSPEREDGRPWDIHADVYSLGVITHELLTGRRPAGPIDQDQDALAGELHAGTSPQQQAAIRQALAGALAADPARRYATPTAFVEALTTGERPAAKPPAPVVAPHVALDPEQEPQPASKEEADLAALPAPAPDDERREAVAAETELERSPVLDQLRAVTRPGLGNHQRFEPRYVGGIHDSPYSGLPAEPAHGPGYAALAAGLVFALALGTGFGYWLRGPGPVVTDAPVIDEPIGTEVPVTPVAEPQPMVVPPAQPTARPTAEPTPRQAPPVGRLLVRSVPDGAIVSIDGRQRGTTPAAIRDLPFGTHNIVVSRPGYERREQRITVSAAVPAREVTIELTKVAAAGPAAAPPAAATGAVYVETRPAGARVSIDGRAVGTSPMRVPELAPGSHRIRVDLAGHKSVTTSVVVRAGQQTTVRLSLEIQ